jgi:hypothetical protein
MKKYPQNEKAKLEHLCEVQRRKLEERSGSKRTNELQ